MGTVEQKSKWRQILIGVMVGAFVAIFTFLLTRLDSKIEKRMTEFQKSQNELIALQMDMIQQQKDTQALLGIEYKSTDYALMIIHDGQYINLKQEKKQELIKDYEFKNKPKGD